MIRVFLSDGCKDMDLIWKLDKFSKKISLRCIKIIIT